MLSEGKAVGFEAWVDSKEDKIRLNEYQVTHHLAQGEKSAYVECYLETIDQPLRIQISRLPTLEDRRDIKVSTHIDGNLLRAKAWLGGEVSCRWDKIVQESATGEEGFITSSLHFTPLPSTDDPTKVTFSPNVLTTLGTIEIILQVGSYRANRRKGQSVSSAITSGNRVVDEKERKLPYAISARNDKKYDLPMLMHYTFTPVSTGSRLYRFLFKYRPRPSLIHLGIIESETQEPEKPFTPPTPQTSLKRKLPPFTTEIDLEDKEDQVVGSQRQAQRIRYLEERIKILSSSQKETLEAAMENGEVIDMTSEDDI
ncbi:hypothetical protein I302_102167 [Kwoniella bestiolae CBS 10118]|uniref:DUF7918 domain-containing protein n=1 Tax=Kwoniella bestiolae CBS 10118 TaxID=1296100 RepID=A0AAJ8M729_9TREE